jgi:hypothetical protein
VSEPSNVVNMKLQGRLIREAREDRAKRKAEREADHISYPTATTDTWNPKVKYPGGNDDMEI